MGSTFSLSHTLNQMLHLRPRNRFEDLDSSTWSAAALIRKRPARDFRISAYQLTLVARGCRVMPASYARDNHWWGHWRNLHDDSPNSTGRRFAGFRCAGATCKRPRCPVAMGRGQFAPTRPIPPSFTSKAGKSSSIDRAVNRRNTYALQHRRDLVSEVIPLLDACNFAEKVAPRLLRDYHPGSAPFWWRGVHLTIRREPLGVGLIVAPSNYPLFIPAVQILQALVAGNAMMVKPAPGCTGPIEALREIAIEAGLQPELFVVLQEGPAAVGEAIAAGVNKVFLTGSAATGRSVLKLAADTLTPIVCELSGCDAMVVLPDADLDVVVKAALFGLRLNEARTCMRPHRLIVHQDVAPALLSGLLKQLCRETWQVDEQLEQRLHSLMRQAEREGATVLSDRYFGRNMIGALLIEGCATTSELWQADIFAPVMAVRRFSDPAESAHLVNSCQYGLGVSIFGSRAFAERIIPMLNVGFVSVNDVIVPTADPRLPFSGRKHSGFGVTRGAGGLLEFTQVKAVGVRRGARSHLLPPHATDESLFAGAVLATHGGTWKQRLQGAARVVGAARQRALHRNQQSL